MRGFTAILLSISLVSLCHALEVCLPPGAPARQLQEYDGVELFFADMGVGFDRSFNCTRIEIRSRAGVLSPEDLLPSPEREVDQILSLVGDAENVALVYRADLGYLAEPILDRLKTKDVLRFVYSYERGKRNFTDILRPLVELKDLQRERIDLVIFLGSYREAILVMPFFRIFKPFPRVVSTWRIYDPLMFAYRSFMRTVKYYEWFPSWLPVIHIRGFVIRYLKRYHRLPSRFAALGYDAANLVYAALRDEKSIRETEIIGVTGIRRMGEGGEPERVYYLVDVGKLSGMLPPPAY